MGGAARYEGGMTPAFVAYLIAVGARSDARPYRDRLAFSARQHGADLGRSPPSAASGPHAAGVQHGRDTAQAGHAAGSHHKVTTLPQKIIMCNFNGIIFQDRSVTL